MAYLILAWISCVLLGVIFKLFHKYGVDTFQGIVYNYIVCVITGALFLGEMPMGPEVWTADWFPVTVVLGSLFVGAFYTAASTIYHFGIAVASVMQRMSLVISVPFSIIVMNEPSTWSKILGVALALVAVILTNIPAQKTEGQIEKHPKTFLIWLFPITVFFFSGAIECILQYVQTHMMHTGEQQEAVFSIYLFAMAALGGIVAMMVAIFRGKLKWAWRNVIGGIALGIPNFFSIFFLLKSFDSMEKSTAISVNNIGIVATTAVLGFFFFHEKLTPLNWLGILLAGIAILAISF